MPEVKATATIDKELYDQVMLKLKGQFTQFMRQIFWSIVLMIKEDRMDELYLYLHGQQDLTLKVNKNQKL